MFDLLLSAEARPFAIALFLFAGLLVLELLALIVGGSLMAFDLDTDVDLDVDAEIEGGFFAWLGLGEVPFLIWFSSLLVAFGLSGMLAQAAAAGVLGAPLSLWIAVPVALVAGLLIAREVGSLVLRVLPQNESSAVARRRLGGRTGTITQGTARADSPAEARVRDVHGNIQYIRVTPADGVAEITQGTEIYVQGNRDGTFTARPLTD